MTDNILSLLKMHEYFRGLSDESLSDIAEHAELVQCESGQCIHQAYEPMTSICFVVRGRLKAIHIDAQGNEHLFQFVERGEQYGLIGAAMTEPLPISIIALEPSTLLKLDYELALDLTIKHPDMRRRWIQTLGQKLRRTLLADRLEEKPTIVAIFHESRRTRGLTDRLIRRLCELAEKPCVFSDRPDWEPTENVPFCSLVDGDRRLSETEIRQQINCWPDSKRVVLDVDATLDSERVSKLVESSDRVLWCARPKDRDSVADRLKAVASRAPGWHDKISIVWLLEDDCQVAPKLTELAIRDFKISTVEARPPLGRTLSNGLERLIHYLRGVQIGVALSGGAARGMAHLGVLKVLEQEGIVVDMIAGTSVGAMTGIVYAAGLDADYCTSQFVDDLRPSWFFRMMPRGSYWYLLYKYRRGHFDRMLRKYLADWRLEQLPIPCHSVTVDLVSGEAVVRERGDAVQAILDSINLPVLSTPICRDGQALVDGGLVKNIPADVLVSKGCNFVIAVSVTAKMEHEFCKNKPDTPTAKMRSPSILQTVLRSFLVQSHNMNSIGVQPADVMIEPDVTGFELTEFTRTKELATIGEQTTLEQIRKIKKLLGRLDNKLFSFD